MRGNQTLQRDRIALNDVVLSFVTSFTIYYDVIIYRFFSDEMQSESKEKMEQGIKNGFSVYNNDNTQKPTMVKYFYFDKDGRQLSEEDVQKLKINVKGNVVLSSGLAGAPIDGNFLDSQGNSFENGTRKTTPQQTSVIKTEPVRQRSVIPNFQASHNGQIYLVTPDGGLRPAEESSEIKTEPDDQEKKNTTEKVMPGLILIYALKREIFYYSKKCFKKIFKKNPYFQSRPNFFLL